MTVVKSFKRCYSLVARIDVFEMFLLYFNPSNIFFHVENIVTAATASSETK